MNLFLRNLLRAYRDMGCPPPADPDWEAPCYTCRVSDAVLAETWRPLAWGLDGPLVAELEDGRFATVEAEGRAWKWKLEAPNGLHGWEVRLVGEGLEPSLGDALYAVERLARGV